MAFDSLTVSAKDMTGNEYLTTFSLNTIDPPVDPTGEPVSDDVPEESTSESA